MKSEAAARKLRRELDEVLAKSRRAPQEPPERGWIHNIREALGMSTHQLAARLKISQAGVVTLEQSEARQTMQLSTLKKIAKAMHCDLVYALAPQAGTLEKALETRRMAVADHALHPFLRKSNLSPAERRRLVAGYAKKLKSKRLWERLAYPEYDRLLERLMPKKRKKKAR